MTKCVEFYEFVDKHGKLCGMTDKEHREAMEYWKEYRQDAERKGDKSPLSEREWFKQQRKTAEVAKHKTEKARQTKSAKNPTEVPKQKASEVHSCSCESCGGTDEDAVKVALHILRQYDCPVDICESVQQWLEEKYGV